MGEWKSQRCNASMEEVKKKVMAQNLGPNDNDTSDEDKRQQRRM